MKVNELRVGNYVNAEVNLLSLQIHKLMPSDIVDVSKGIVEIYPIELTEEILLKCGFKYKSYGYGEKEWKQWNNGKITLNGFLETRSGNNLKYLHQLQNLYFALTNEELEINL